MANRLAAESSPYLLQHKDNPVDWYPWGPEAFARAKAEDRPVFLSIGYSTCHWCHVMEHESFETDRIAEALNRDFVSIKVDREERPDVDDIYMQAVQMMTGSGGWPLSLFLTPDGRPFYGGTYFPPTSRWGRPGFLQILAAIAEGWKTRRDELETSAGEMLAHLEAGAAAALRAGANELPADLLDTAAAALSRQFDPVEGGFGGAPKFPPAMRLELLIRRSMRRGDPEARAMVEKTLDRMAAGGMYDQVGGGFHRYSVDARWLVPHFEKMLYDNAMLARVYVLAHRAFGVADYARVARETLDYLLAEMTPAGGGFFAAQDADSGGEEGTFYVWNPQSLAAAVGDDAAPIVAARFGVTAAGNFEGGETVLSVVRTLPQLAAEFGRPEQEIARLLAEARGRMYAARGRRVRPGTDDKLLTDWTALAISAFALAGRVLSEPRYEKAAAGRGRPDPRTLHARRPAAPPRESRPGRHPGLLDRLRVPHRGVARPVRGDFRAALLPGGRPAPVRLRVGLRGSGGRVLPLRRAARRPHPPARRVLRRRDTVLQFRRGDEPAAPGGVHRRRRPPAPRRRGPVGLRGRRREGLAGFSTPSLRPRLPDRLPARGRARGRARTAPISRRSAPPPSHRGS